MASPEQVKHYLAHWFQLGKRVLTSHQQDLIHPETIIQGECFSAEFEESWNNVIALNAGDSYLEGTTERIQDLLENEWEITSCARCTMPIAMRYRGTATPGCPCGDLPSWPNMEIPLPRSPVKNSPILSDICRRVLSKEQCIHPLSVKEGDAPSLSRRMY